MKFYNLMVLLLSVSAAGVYKKTHAEFAAVGANNATADIARKETKTVIELNKDITVNTGLNLDKTLAQLKGREDSNKPKIRKVTPVDNDSLERKLKIEVNAKGKNVSTTEPPSQVTKLLTEAGVINIKQLEKIVQENNTAKLEKNKENKPSTSNQSSISGNKTVLSLANSTINSGVQAKEDKNSNNDTTTLTAEKSSPASTTTTAKPTLAVATNLTTTNITSTMVSLSTASDNLNKTSTTTPTSTTTTKATKTTATTTTPKPKKPTVTYSIPDFPDLEKDNPKLNNLLQPSASNKLTIPPDGPYAQPSQEFNSNFHRGRDFIVPIVSMIFIIPLVIGILITSYRRFRDCWSTRHYRRMDFLVDGMYND